MLYRFQSQATKDLIMLEPQGRLFLEILNKPPKGPGILLSADLPAAIHKIQAAIEAEENKQKEELALRAALLDEAPSAAPASLGQTSTQGQGQDQQHAQGHDPGKVPAKAKGKAPHRSNEHPSDTVWLRQRAQPLLDMFRRSIAEKSDVVWGL